MIWYLYAAFKIRKYKESMNAVAPSSLAVLDRKTKLALMLNDTINESLANLITIAQGFF
jgi:hypothetical protein